MSAIQLKWISTSAKLQAFKPKGVIINKVFNHRQLKKKLKVSNTFVAPLQNKFTNLEVHKSFADNKRVIILNRLFMRHITDLLATGEVAADLLDEEIEITKIRVTSDFQRINVYWYSSKEFTDTDDIESRLESAANHLHHELSQLQVIGNVPPITFCKDEKFNVLLEIEKRFAKIDVECKTDEADCDENLNENDQNDEFEIPIPQMKQNVMGFDHSVAMNKIKASMDKIQKPTENLFDVPEAPEDILKGQENLKALLSSKEEKKLFSDFLKTRAIEEKRRKRKKMGERNYNDVLQEVIHG